MYDEFHKGGAPKSEAVLQNIALREAGGGGRAQGLVRRVCRMVCTLKAVHTKANFFQVLDLSLEK